MDEAQFTLHAEVEEQHWWFVARRRIVAELLACLVPPHPNALIIDVGCGTGANIASLADRYRSVGIDPNAQAIAFARKRYPDVEFRHGLAPDALGELPTEAAAVLMMDVLEHVEDEFPLFSGMAQRLPKGAYLIITVPADPALWSPHDVSFGHYRRYTEARLRRIWQDLPLHCELFSPFNSRLYPIIWFLRRLGRLRRRCIGDAETDVRNHSSWVNGMLENIFSSERGPLAACLGHANPAFRRGCSYIAILRREAGEITPQTRPADVEPDENFRR